MSRAFFIIVIPFKKQANPYPLILIKPMMEFLKKNILPLILLCVGVVLLVYMIQVEGEPGALPLLLIAAPLIWLLRYKFIRRSL